MLNRTGNGLATGAQPNTATITTTVTITPQSHQNIMEWNFDKSEGSLKQALAFKTPRNVPKKWR
jgi:hypothetical protein